MPPASGAQVKWTPDIQQWMRQLKEASDDRLDLEVRKVWRESAERVRGRARGRAQGARPPASDKPNNGPQHWQDLVNSIKSGATGKSPFVSVGSSRVPWALGFEYGSAQHRQFPPWLGNGPTAGRFFWPQIREDRPQVVKEATDALEEAFGKAFPKG